MHKAPANEPVRGARRPGATTLNDTEQGVLNHADINALRRFPGRPPLVWGARTLTDEYPWRYVNVRRLVSFIEDSLLQGLRWAVFEPNNIALWKGLERTITEFLTRVWQSGALFGRTADGGVLRQDRRGAQPGVRCARWGRSSSRSAWPRSGRPSTSSCGSGCGTAAPRSARVMQRRTSGRWPQTGQRVDPYRSFNFLVELDGIAQASFTECSGLGSTTEVIENREGGDNTTVRKLPGKTSYSDITLKWGLTDSTELWDWRQQIVDGQRRAQERLDRRLRPRQPHRGGALELRPRLADASGRGRRSTPRATRSPIETLVLAHEGLVRA